jgi:hypothetical protein
MAHIVDRYRDQITQLAQRKELVRARKAAFDEFRVVTQRSCDKLGISGNTIADAEPAHDLLQEMHSEIVASLESLVTGYSSIRWLFMLRRLPQYVFEGQLVSTIAYDSALADVLSARSTSVEQIRRQDSTFYFHVDGGCVRRLLRFCEGVRTLSQIHVLARWCGKGAKLQIAKDWFPSAETPEELREAVRLYDTRCEIERSGWSAAGTIFHEDSTAAAECILVADRMYPQQIQLPDGNTIDATVAPRLISLSDVRQLTQNAKLVANTPWPPESALALWIARSIWFYFGERHDSLPLIRQILNTGYLLIGHEIAEQWISEVAADCNEFVKDAVGHSLNFTSLDDLLTAARKDHGQVWPLLPRDLIRTLPGTVCVDLCAAEYAIRDSLEYTEEQGAVANVRSEHFEAAVQNMIDGTKWRPDGEARKLIGLKLKKGKSEITDIDAVGISGKTLLLVSCKSRLKSRLYDIGKYSVVRNAATAMATAQSEWEAIIERLRSDPGGYNWDFAGYSTIIGVVCTSSVFYAPLSVMAPESADRVRIMGFNELRAWLVN